MSVMNVIASRKSRTLRKLATAVGFVALTGAAACVAGGEGEPAEPTAQEQAAAQQRHHVSPVAIMVDSALAHADLSDDQAAQIRTIGESYQLLNDDKTQMRDKMRASAAGIVRAGTTDSEQFDDAVDTAAEAIEARIAASAEAMKQIHASLDADQRAAVADALHEQVQQRWGQRHKQDNARKRVDFKQVAAHLMLSPLQIDKLKVIRDQFKQEDGKRFRPSREEIDGLIDTFETDAFGEALDAFNAEKIALMQARINEVGQRTDTALSLLSESQRDLLAELIEEGPRKVLFGEQQAQHSAD